MMQIPKWQEILSWLEKMQQKPLKPGLCCISFYANGIAAALVIRDEHDVAQLKRCIFAPYKKGADASTTLATMVAKNKLANIACSWLLQPTDYKLLMMDALPLTPEEMHDALRWQVKDLVNMPGSDIVLDYFQSPVATSRSKANPLGVIVANQKELQRQAELIHASGLALTTIDVPEFSMRNLAALHAEAARGLGIILMQPEYCSVIIIQDHQVYMSRNVEHSLKTIFTETEDATLDPVIEERLNELALEIQRSLDYYQAQLRQKLPKKLLITLYKPLAFEHLARQLSVPLEMLEIAPTLSSAALDRTSFYRTLPVIGGALRVETNHAAD